jgi:Tfp pilus assembly protein PilO
MTTLQIVLTILIMIIIVGSAAAFLMMQEAERKKRIAAVIKGHATVKRNFQPRMCRTSAAPRLPKS